MNFSPIISGPMAIFMAVAAASMWGTWFISLKHMPGYPIDAFYITLFTVSFLFVWSVGLIIDGRLIFVDIVRLWNINPFKLIIVFFGGVSYVVGMSLSLKVMTLIGLTLSQPLQASISLFMGTIITTTIGGIPDDFSLTNLLISVLFLFSAVIFVGLAENSKRIDQNLKAIDTGLSRDRAVMKKAILLIVVASIFSPGYTLALSYGLGSVTQKVGLSVLPYMCVLVSGAFTGALLTSGVKLTRRRQWHLLFQAPFSIHRWGIMSGLFHYGGNIIHTFATGVLSSAISWPLGLTAGLWTQLWGIRYGEFKGSSAKTYIFQICSFACYILGAFFIVMK